MQNHLNQKGVSIIAVIATMLILAVMGVTLISLVTTGSDISVNQLRSEQAFNIAQGGIQYGLYTTTRGGGSWGEFNFPSKSLGMGNFVLTTNTSIVGTERRMTLESTGSVTGPMAARRVRAEVKRGIAFDAASSNSGNTNSLSWLHTVSGAKRILIVGVSIRDTNMTVGGITYGGAPLTFIDAQNNGTNCRVELWMRVAPATGANNVIVTLSGSTRVVGGAVSFTNVDQASPIDAGPTFAVGNSTAPSVAVTIVTDNAWVMDNLAFNDNATDTVGPGQTERWNRDNGGGAGRINGAGSTEGPKTPAGAVTMSWTLSAAQQWAIGAVALKPASAGVTLLSWQEQY